jgi:hypothetical protein
MSKSKEQQELDDYLARITSSKQINQSDDQIIGWEKAANSRKGLKRTSAQKRTMSKAQTGRIVTDVARQKTSDTLSGKTLEEILGEERGAAGREARRKATTAQHQSGKMKDAAKKTADTRRANGSYGTSMLGKEHKDSTISIMSQKATVRQEIKKKLGLGKADKVPKELLEAEYKKRGWQ